MLEIKRYLIEHRDNERLYLFVEILQLGITKYVWRSDKNAAPESPLQQFVIGFIK